MKRSNFALRLQASLLQEARKAAELEGVALNQLINVAVAEKVSALRTEEYFQERSRRADRSKTQRILQKAGKDKPAVPGDELPAGWTESTPKSGRKIARFARPLTEARKRKPRVQ